MDQLVAEDIPKFDKYVNVENLKKEIENYFKSKGSNKEAMLEVIKKFGHAYFKKKITNNIFYDSKQKEWLKKNDEIHKEIKNYLNELKQTKKVIIIKK